jgi:hypothetical protein
MSSVLVSWLLNLQLFFFSTVIQPPSPGFQSPYKLNSSNFTLFYIERNKNANAVIYDANVLKDGDLDSEMPLDVYYIHYATDGKRCNLNYIEKKLAYGYKFKKISSKEFVIQLVALPERELILRKQGNQSPTLSGSIAGKPCNLLRVYVYAKPGLYTDVVYVDLFGKHLADGALVHERINR